ncbi:hypothetical protein [Phenylobacterium sp.]|jgi:hypothetical protein|uniref:hypothetical protein n=1 Tax=Phenylobacterium sp. TaxID=1871053 RepID=UPI002E36548A|nr:hypothetical protein [Phenylobacterium sp.]HEX3365923.1 hypothetical protein [Phenylobacterium sp.]
MQRRTIIIAIAAAAFALAAPALAADKTLEADKAFPYLAAYLKLPLAERNHFTMAYYLHLGAEPLKAPAWLVEGAKRTPLSLRADGKVERLPDLAQLEHGQLEIGIDAATKINNVLGVEPLLAPATDLDAHELAVAIAQAAVGSRKAVGVMAMAMPKLTNVGFVGVPSGEVEFADGHKAPLPLVKGVPTYTPEAQPNATRIHLPAVPRKLDMG